jgi:hypothetical protein
MMKRKTNNRGFAMLVVVMIVALVSVVGLTLLNFLRIDLSIVGQNRRTTEARFLADAGNIELVDDVTTESILPDPRINPDLVVDVPPVLNSWVNRPLGEAGSAPETYGGRISLLRAVPISESTLTITRGLVFEVATIGSSNNGDATSEVRSEVIKVTSVPAGTILTPLHAR